MPPSRRESVRHFKFVYLLPFFLCYPNRSTHHQAINESDTCSTMDLERKPESPSLNCPDIDPFLTGSIADIDRNITFLQNSLPLYPRSHSGHINCVYSLAEERWKRYRLSQDKEDLNKSIAHSTEAIFLPPVSRDGPLLNSIFKLLFHIAFALLVLSRKFEQHEGVKHSIEYFRYLRGHPFDSFDILRNDVTTLLIVAFLFKLGRMLGTGHGISRRWWSSAANSSPQTNRQTCPSTFSNPWVWLLTPNGAEEGPSSC